MSQGERHANIKFHPFSLNFSKALEKPENGRKKSSGNEGTDFTLLTVDTSESEQDWGEKALD